MVRKLILCYLEWILSETPRVGVGVVVTPARISKVRCGGGGEDGGASHRWQRPIGR
jgi:hypothetical protein